MTSLAIFIVIATSMLLSPIFHQNGSNYQEENPHFRAGVTAVKGLEIPVKVLAPALPTQPSLF
jgi:hypothetical protein